LIYGCFPEVSGFGKQFFWEAAGMAEDKRGALVITGASKGIGEACALHMARLGYEVFAGVRTPADGEALQQKAGGRLTPIYLDVTIEDKIAAAAAHVNSIVGAAGLVGLVNNAGIAVTGPLEFLPLEDLRRQMEVNFIGQVAVTQAFMPLLRRGHGRIVNVSSVSGKIAYPFFGPYASSKFALEAYSDALRRELLPWGMHVSVVEPGSIATPIWETSLERAEHTLDKLPAKALTLYGQAMQASRHRARALGRRGLPPGEVAEVVAHALTSKRPRRRYIVGRGTRYVIWLARLGLDALIDWGVSRSLYK
jgi:NAD(P)-dependent dehydrogenase (short-subunit alcohol dehydrogenase family)